MDLKISAVRCGCEPLPAELYFSAPGFDFASAISSCAVCACTDGCTMSKVGRLTRLVMRVKSLSGSKGRLG